MLSLPSLTFRFYARFFPCMCRIRCLPAAVLPIRPSSFFVSPCSIRRCLHRRPSAFFFCIERGRRGKNFERGLSCLSSLSSCLLQSKPRGLSVFRFSYGCRSLPYTYFFQLAEPSVFSAENFGKTTFRFFCRTVKSIAQMARYF